VKGIEIQYDVFKKEEEYLLETLASAKKELITLNSKEISYLQAEREMKTNQELYVALKKEYIKYLSLYKLPDMIVDVVEKARVPLPRENVKPQTLINVAFAGVGSLLIGIILVLVYGFIELEVFQNVREMAFSLMGIIPLGLTQTINNVPKNSVKYDSFRGIAARLNLMQKKEKIKTVFVTSCGAGEGKTTVAVNLAIVMADTGKRVLLIDGNRKKSDVANLFDIYESAPGFRDIEEYKDNFKSLITPIVYKNIDIIGGGSVIVNDGTENDGAGFIKDELVKDDIDNLINSLKKYYDFIIIDGPSLIGIHDAIILSNVSDGVLMVVGHKMYPPVTEKEMSKEVEKAKSRLLGVILNHVYQGDEIYKSYYQRSSKKFAYI
ncbi:AAA family ATPase, partial [bacterium]|nr:AAA family ATPase [bacterium]